MTEISELAMTFSCIELEAVATELAGKTQVVRAKHAVEIQGAIKEA